MDEPQSSLLSEIERILENLQGLIDRAAPGSLFPEKTRFIQWKVAEDFSYGDAGVEMKGGLRGRQIDKLTWNFAGSQLTARIRGTLEFAAATKSLETFLDGSRAAETLLSNFVLRVAQKFLENQPSGRTELTAAAESFLAAVSPGQKEHGADVELLGLTLRSPSIQLPGILIRQTRREDLEKEVPDCYGSRERINIRIQALSPKSGSSVHHSTHKFLSRK